MKLVAALILNLFSICSWAQLSEEKQIESMRLLELGAKHLKEGEFKKADSVLTLSMNIIPRFNAIFNRAIARVNLKDTCGFCEDLKSVIPSQNDMPRKLYYKFCASSDTSFFDKKNVKSGKKDHRYYEIRQVTKCSKDTSVELYDRRKAGYSNVAPGVSSYSTGLIAGYNIKRGRELFYFTEEPPKIGLAKEDFPTYIKTTTSIPLEILSKLKVKHIVTKEGKIDDVRVFMNNVRREDYGKEISRVLNKIDLVIPASYQKKPVDIELTYELN